MSWIHSWVRNPETKGLLSTNAWLHDIQNQALCKNQCNQLEIWLDQQICNWQYFSQKLQIILLVKKASQRLVELGRQGSVTRRKICESAGYIINYGGVSEVHWTHFNSLTNKIDYRINHDVSLEPIYLPLRTMKSDCERTLSVVKMMLQTQFCSFRREILAGNRFIYALIDHFSGKLRVPICEH